MITIECAVYNVLVNPHVLHRVSHALFVGLAAEALGAPSDAVRHLPPLSSFAIGQLVFRRPGMAFQARGRI
jgi:hypothetical protein